MASSSTSLSFTDVAQSSLLQRAENLYLNILRVLILAVATLALLGAIVGLLGGLPLLKASPTSTTAPPSSLQAATLGDYVSEKKAAGQDVTTSPDAASTTSTVISSVGIKDAAQNIVSYVRTKMNGTLGLEPTIRELQGFEADIPEPFHTSYETSLVSLTKQLTLSTGAALTPDSLEDLLRWHAAKFKTAAEEDAAKLAEEKLQASQRIQLGAYALLTFLLLVFAFIFVKIERNLRVVRTLTTVNQ